jgi:glutaredoxin
MTSIQVYGTDWCRLTFGVREYLINSRVDYDYFDIERDPLADEFVRTVNDGRQRYPVVVVEDHSVTNPTLAELDALLRDHRVEPRPGAGARRRQPGDL